MVKSYYHLQQVLLNTGLVDLSSSLSIPGKIRNSNHNYHSLSLENRLPLHLCIFLVIHKDGYFISYWCIAWQLFIYLRYGKTGQSKAGLPVT